MRSKRIDRAGDGRRAAAWNGGTPDHLIPRGIPTLPTLGDGRQSGTSDAPSILDASPEIAVVGGLSWLPTGNTIRIDLDAGTYDALAGPGGIARRCRDLPAPPSHTPRQDVSREKTTRSSDGGMLDVAVTDRGIAARRPRHNH